MAQQFKARECVRCNEMFIENIHEERERKLKLAKCLCHECLAEFEKVKKQKKLPKLYYIDQYEPLMF